MKFLIYELFSGVGFCNQLFSLETAIYLANICDRKLILLIRNPLCHCGRASWDYGNFLDYFNDDYKQFLTNGIEVYYRQSPEKWKNIINSKSCKTLNFKYRFSNLIMVDPELNIDSNKKNINLFCNGRQKISINLKEIDDTYIYINKSNASRCFYNFYTTKNNYYLMSKICDSLKNLNKKINKFILNINNFDLSIHLRLGDGHKSKSTIDSNFNRLSQSLLKKISILDNVENILLMSDRKDAEIIDILKTKYKNISFTEDLIKDIKFDDISNIKNMDIVKFLIQKNLCERSNHFIGTIGSTVSNYIQYIRFLNDKEYNLYSKKTIITLINNYTWNNNNIYGVSLSWSCFWPDNIYAIKYPEYRKDKYYIKIIKEINISPKKNKKVISYCLYGLNNDRNRKRHFDKGIYVNYYYMKNHNYKDWIMRVYIPYDEPDDIINNIRQFRDIEIILVDTNICLRALRFLPNDDPNVKVWLSRDLDSIVNNREEKAVEDWLENRNDKNLMIMSDNRQHTWTIAGGMFGYKNDFKKNISQYLVEYNFINNKNHNHYANDCVLAENFFYTNNNYIQYYRSGKKLANSIPFPDLSSIHCGFVGNISPIDRYYINLKCEEIYPFLSNKSILKNNDKFLYSPWKCFFKNKDPICTLIWEGDDFTLTVDINSKSQSGSLRTINGDGKKILKLDTTINILWGGKDYKEAYMPNKNTISVKHGKTWYNFDKVIDNKAIDNKAIDNKAIDNKVITNKAIDNKAIDNKAITNKAIDNKVSIIIPTYNRFNFLINAIKSVKDQTYTNLEIIVVNDCSTQREYYDFDWKKEGIIIIHLKENSKKKFGFACAGFVRNKGIEISTGEYIAFCDDDDIWFPKKIELQLESMKKTGCNMSSTEGLVGHGIYNPKKTYKKYNSELYYNTLRNIHRKRGSNILDNGFPDIWDFKFLKIHNCMICSSVIVKKEILDKIGNFNNKKPPGEDYDCWLRALHHTDSVYIKDICFYYDSNHGNGQLYL